MLLRRTFLAGAAVVLSLSAAQKPAPKLILGIVADQFRYDYLARFRGDFTAGFARFYERGAVFTSTYLEHAPTVTGIGHATFLTGATPALSGIVGNDWYDREVRKPVNCTSDPTVHLLGGQPGLAGASPRRLLVTTVGDELKLARRGKPRLIGISLKDRGAILPAGHTADGAYWFDDKTGNFVSSTYYFPDLPGWVKEFNAARPADKYLRAEWKPLVASPDWPSFAKIMPGTYPALEKSPFGNELVEQFAERAIDAEKLGQRDTTDLLSVSFSANDYIGHEYGPFSPEVRDITIRTDRLIGKLLEFVNSRVGLDNVIVVFTADHGVAPVPERMREQRGPAGRLTAKTILNTVEAALDKRFGAGDWVIGSKGPDPYLNRELIAARGLAQAEVERAAADAVRALPHVARVYTREQLLKGYAASDQVGRRVLNGFYAPRAPDIVTILDPYFIDSASGTTHGSPYGYDAHVPLVLMGPGIKPGVYHVRAASNDIAPTLAALLWIEPPGGSVGRVLAEALQ